MRLPINNNQYVPCKWTLFGWVPDVHKKLDTKQITFKIPQELLALTRKILFKRYACDVGNRQGFSVRWIDQDKRNTDIKITDSVDLTHVPTSLPCDKLYKSKIQVNSESQKLVTISVYYTTGTVLVQGVECRTWLKDEFDALIQVIRAVYAFVGSKKYPGLENAVRECLSTLPILSATELPSWKGGISDCSPQNTPLRPLMSKLTLLATLHLPADKECHAAVSPPWPFPLTAAVWWWPALGRLVPTRHALILNAVWLQTAFAFAFTTYILFATTNLTIVATTNSTNRNGTCVAQRPARSKPPSRTPHHTSNDTETIQGVT